VKIAICLPVYETFKAETTISLLGLSIHTLSQRRDIEFETVYASGVRIWMTREDLAASALQMGADWLLWVDSDMSFSQPALLQLLSHDLPFVAANYMQRRSPEPTASRRVGDRYQRVWSTTEVARRLPLEAVDIVGFGLCLTRADLFRRLPRPWFADGPNGEDGDFCEKAGRIGVRPHVDHVLSLDVGHVAERVLFFPR
jgi:hypothetical protein